MIPVVNKTIKSRQTKGHRLLIYGLFFCLLLSACSSSNSNFPYASSNRKDCMVEMSAGGSLGIKCI